MALWFKKRTRQDVVEPAPEKKEKEISATEQSIPKQFEILKTGTSEGVAAKPAEQKAQEIKPPVPILKPVEEKAEAPAVQASAVLKQVPPREEEKPELKVTIAEKAAATPPRDVDVAADKPAVPRSDPKALYYQLMNGLYDVILVLDDDGHVIDCNERAESVFGYSSDDAWNMPIDKIVYGMNTRMFSLLKENIKSKQHILLDARCFRSNGTSFIAEIGVSSITLTRSGNVVFAIRNIERRKSGQEEVRKLRAALDIVNIPAFTCDMNGTFEVFNSSLLKAFGIADEMEAKRKRLTDILPDMTEQFNRALMGENVRETKKISDVTGNIYTIDLELRPVRKGEEISGVAGSAVIS
jgi:PAS domain S-box-containing protein